MKLLAISVVTMLAVASVKAGPTTQPEALASAESAARAAAELAGKSVALGAPRLYNQAHGLAVDRSDPNTPRVVGYVGPSWIVPAVGEAGKPGPRGFVLDRGTGKLVARAHEVVALPKQGVYYIDDWRLPASALGPRDSITSHCGVNLIAVMLDLGNSQLVPLFIRATGQKSAKQAPENHKLFPEYELPSRPKGFCPVALMH